MPSYWLVKTEPDVFSIDDLERAPKRTTSWGGVRNFAARGHLRAMREGDLAFVYHSNGDPSAVVGVAEVVKEAYADPTQFDAGDEMAYDPRSTKDDPKWVAVDLRFRERLPRPVPLDEVKRTPALAKMALVRISRLSVQPVTAAEWRAVMALSRQGAKDAKRAKPGARKRAAADR